MKFDDVFDLKKNQHGYYAVLKDNDGMFLRINGKIEAGTGSDGSGYFKSKEDIQAAFELYVTRDNPRSIRFSFIPQGNEDFADLTKKAVSFANGKLAMIGEEVNRIQADQLRRVLEADRFKPIPDCVDVEWLDRADEVFKDRRFRWTKVAKRFTFHFGERH